MLRSGLCFGGAALAFATGFAAAKLRTEMVRAPVLAHELRYTNLTGFVEAHELRDKGRARITLRVLTLDDLEPEDRALSALRVTLPAKDVSTLGNRRSPRRAVMSGCRAPARREPIVASLTQGWALISGAAVTSLGTAITPASSRMTHYGLSPI